MLVSMSNLASSYIVLSQKGQNELTLSSMSDCDDLRCTLSWRRRSFAAKFKYGLSAIIVRRQSGIADFIHILPAERVSDGNVLVHVITLPPAPQCTNHSLSHLYIGVVFALHP